MVPQHSTYTFIHLIFVTPCTDENVLTMKVSRSMVVHFAFLNINALYMCMYVCNLICKLTIVLNTFEVTELG